LGYAIYWAGQGQAKEVTNKAAFFWKEFPTFVLGFLFVSLLVEAVEKYGGVNEFATRSLGARVCFYPSSCRSSLTFRRVALP
jgi:hypothetical protein